MRATISPQCGLVVFGLLRMMPVVSSGCSTLIFLDIYPPEEGRASDKGTNLDAAVVAQEMQI